jgi:hypothetical protein
LADGTSLSKAQFAELIEGCCQLDKRDAGVYAAIRHRFRKPPAHPELAIGFSVRSSVTVLEVLPRPGCRPPTSLVEELFGRVQIEPLPRGQKLLSLKLSP